jgi:hypothetical protein
MAADILKVPGIGEGIASLPAREQWQRPDIMDIA